MRIIWGMRFKQVEKRILADGWQYYSQAGRHCQYIHPTKKGKVTIPKHNGDIPPIVVKSIWKQAGINEKKTK